MPKYDLSLKNPYLNAAGSLGFAPDSRGPIDLRNIGAFVTNPVSLSRRVPASGTRFIPFPGGFLLHTGFPNPGIGPTIQRFAQRWQESDVPVIVHLLAQEPQEISQMVVRLESLEGVTGIEIGIPPDADANGLLALVEAAIGELPVIVRLPFESTVHLAALLVDLPISAVSLSPPRGTLPDHEGKVITGRLYGPAIFPLAMATIQTMIATGLPVIGSGGVYQHQEAELMLAAGVIGVQLDTVFWRQWDF
jgi:dihydroorotate dehydrogenase (NAD+) catalytic subunit